MQTIFIDFDGTITPLHGFSMDPNPEVIEAINALYDSGTCEIVIYSCRANPQICDSSDVERMEKYLKRNLIRYHRVQHGKPHFHFIIDDRSMNPNYMTWKDIAQIILEDKN